MAKETIDILVEGGKASAAPPLGPALGPMGVNIGEVVSEINNQTSDFKGMKVPVKVIIDTNTKKFQIKIGTPPASALIKQEAGIKKGAQNPLTDKVADLKIEQIIKIAKMKSSSLLGKDNVSKAKEIIGTCQSMGILVEGEPALNTIKAINEGKFVDKIMSGKTELSTEELKEMEEEKIKLQQEVEEKRSEFEAKTKEILSQMEGKTNKEIIAALTEAEIPSAVFDSMLPEEKKEGEKSETPSEKDKETEKKD